MGNCVPSGYTDDQVMNIITTEMFRVDYGDLFPLIRVNKAFPLRIQSLMDSCDLNNSKGKSINQFLMFHMFYRKYAFVLFRGVVIPEIMDKTAQVIYRYNQSTINYRGIHPCVPFEVIEKLYNDGKFADCMGRVVLTSFDNFTHTSPRICGLLCMARVIDDEQYASNTKKIITFMLSKIDRLFEQDYRLCCSTCKNIIRLKWYCEGHGINVNEEERRIILLMIEKSGIDFNKSYAAGYHVYLP